MAQTYSNYSVEEVLHLSRAHLTHGLLSCCLLCTLSVTLRSIAFIMTFLQNSVIYDFEQTIKHHCLIFSEKSLPAIYLLAINIVQKDSEVCAGYILGIN